MLASVVNSLKHKLDVSGDLESHTCIGGIGKSLTSSNNIMLLRGQRGERVGRIDGKHTAFVLEFF